MPIMAALMSLEDADGFRCVDILQHADGTFFFKEFRRDPEDSGRWTLLGDYSHLSFSTRDQAVQAAESRLSWFMEVMRNHRRDIAARFGA
jgi:hypothetical protein